MKKSKSKYAIPCTFSDSESDEGFDEEKLFFVTFETRNEDEALRLASCVCGKRGAGLALVIINEHGQVFPL